MLPPRLFPLFLILSTSPLAAQSGLYADFDVGEDIGQGFGTLSFTVELDIPFSLIDTTAAPRLVANFIRLAEGNTPWIDETTGQAKKEPFFDGLRFYQLFDDLQIHFGSRDNTGDDGPGYFLQDDFRANSTALYGLYMDNDGYNSNGSRFFISILNNPAIQETHCRIGHVVNTSPPTPPLPASHFPGEIGFLNVRAISYGDTDGSGVAEQPFITINSVTIRRLSPLAIAFDEDVWSIPDVGPLRIELDGSTHRLKWSDTPGSSAFFSTSHDLQTWSAPTQLFDSPLADTLGKDISEDILNFPRTFYRGAGIIYPFVPSSQISFPGEVLQINHPGFGVIYYFFNPFDPEEPDAPIGGAYSGGGESGDFLLDAAVIFDPYKQIITLSHENDDLPRFFLHLHCDLDHSVDFESGANTIAFPSRLTGGELEAITEPIIGDLLVNLFSGEWRIVP